MLHVTNGDSAVERIRAAGVEGTLLPWRDVLHEGPVPAGLPLERLSDVRAEFLASQGWADAERARREFAERDAVLARSVDEDEVVLWFEHDLYDQLQLIQLLDWFADHPHPRLSLVNPAEYLGLASPARLAELFDARAPVTPAQLALGRRAWEAFRAPDPRRVEEVIRGETSALPHLGAALRRLLQELPDADTGLSRTERQILEAFARGPRRVADAYAAAHHAVEEAVWMGDATFAAYVDALASTPTPLLAWYDPEPEDDDLRARMKRQAATTDAGRQAVNGSADAVWMNGIDRWIGGVHLSGRSVPWRWDADAERIVPG